MAGIQFGARLDKLLHTSMRLDGDCYRRIRHSRHVPAHIPKSYWCRPTFFPFFLPAPAASPFFSYSFFSPSQSPSVAYLMNPEFRRRRASWRFISILGHLIPFRKFDGNSFFPLLPLSLRKRRLVLFICSRQEKRNLQRSCSKNRDLFWWRNRIDRFQSDVPKSSVVTKMPVGSDIGRRKSL